MEQTTVYSLHTGCPRKKNFALEWYAAFSSQIALRELHSYTV